MKDKAMSRRIAMPDVIEVGSILELFREEVADLDGVVLDEVDDGSAAYARALFPTEAEVVPGDAVRAGVAMRCIDDEVEVRPYVQRRVCRNGAVISHSTLGRVVELHDAFDVKTALLEVRHAIRGAAAYDAFAEFVDAMRTSRTLEPDLALLLMSFRRSGGIDEPSLLILMRRFRDNGSSAYALGNAMTSLARDTIDPELRWRREAIGADVFVRCLAGRAAVASGARIAAHA
jgi:hypothetical protein